MLKGKAAKRAVFKKNSNTRVWTSAFCVFASNVSDASRDAFRVGERLIVTKKEEKKEKKYQNFSKRGDFP